MIFAFFVSVSAKKETQFTPASEKRVVIAAAAAAAACWQTLTSKSQVLEWNWIALGRVPMLVLLTNDEWSRLLDNRRRQNI